MNTSNYRVSIDERGVVTERMFMCRCGVTHTGDYAEYEYLHHMCFHDAAMWDIGAGQFCCADCGKSFFVERKPLTRWQRIIEYLKVLYR